MIVDIGEKTAPSEAVKTMIFFNVEVKTESAATRCSLGGPMVAFCCSVWSCSAGAMAVSIFRRS